MEYMSNLWLTITTAFMNFSIRDAVDIAIVTVILYNLLMATKGTRAIQVFKGIGLLLVGAVIADFFKLASVQWLLNTLLQSGVIFLIILFQPELRKILEGLGRGRMFKGGYSIESQSEVDRIVTEIRNVLDSLSKRKVGALIVMQNTSSLSDIIDNGTKLDARISGQLIENIFEPNTPLHDGAMIIAEGRIAAAGCVLPLSENYNISKELGTRHRAGLGISEQTDSITFIVSEETGVISYTRDGKIIRYIDPKTISDLIIELYGSEEQKSKVKTFIRGLKNENKL